MTMHGRAEFDYDLDDLVDVSMRNIGRSPSIRAQHRRAAWIFTPIVAVAFGAVAHFLDPDRPAAAIVFALGAGVALPIVYFRILPKHQRRNLHRYLQERNGDGPHRCTVELHDEHMLWRQGALDWRLAWSDVRAIEYEGDDVVVQSRTGVSVLRGRAFANAEAREQFVAAALRLQRDAATAKVS